MIVKSSRAFRGALERLDRSEQLLVLKTVEQIKSSNGDTGKELSGPLHDCKSLRTGHHGRLRIVFSTAPKQPIQLLIVGPRERGIVYIQAIQVLKELER